MVDYDVLDLQEENNVYVVVSTAGQGEFPIDCKDFWRELSNPELPKDLLQNVKFSVFGLGDSSYVYFNEAAKLVEKRFVELGGQQLTKTGLGDDRHDEKYETEWQEWSPELFNQAGLKAPPEELLPPSFHVAIIDEKVEDERYVPKGYQ